MGAHPEDHVVLHKYYSRNEIFLSFTVNNHQPYQTSKRWASVEVVTQTPQSLNYA